jgi:hypothetical protein
MELTQTELAQLIETAKRERDSAWTSQVLGVSGKSLTPAEAAQWLQQDRIQRARLVTDAARCKGHPKRY